MKEHGDTIVVISSYASVFNQNPCHCLNQVRQVGI